MLNKVRIVTDAEGRTRIFIDDTELHFVTHFSLEQEGGEGRPTLSISLQSNNVQFEGSADAVLFVDIPHGWSEK